jgi:hypothetical protein
VEVRQPLITVHVESVIHDNLCFIPGSNGTWAKRKVSIILYSQNRVLCEACVATYERSEYVRPLLVLQPSLSDMKRVQAHARIHLASTRICFFLLSFKTAL